MRGLRLGPDALLSGLHSDNSIHLIGFFLRYTLRLQIEQLAIGRRGFHLEVVQLDIQ